jgi:hypothetical protein
MNFSQMHECLRLELRRRIQRGTVSVSLLARQTGLGQSHLSNFLHSHRQHSIDALDHVLAAQHLTMADLLPALDRAGPLLDSEEDSAIPVASHAAALFEPVIRSSVVHSMLHLPGSALSRIRTRVSAHRRAWQRFVAVRIPAADAFAMEPLILPEAIVLIDRHYISLAPYSIHRPNLYAVRHGAHLTVRYVDLLSNHLVLRPISLAVPVGLVEIDPGDSPNDQLAGRVALILNET